MRPKLYNSALPIALVWILPFANGTTGLGPGTPAVTDSTGMAIPSPPHDPPQGDPDRPLFHYDPTDRSHPGRIHVGPDCYDGDLVRWGEATHLALLQVDPLHGDRILAGIQPPEGVATPLAESLGALDLPFRRIAHPTLTVDARGGLNLSFEAESSEDGPWNLYHIRRGDVGGWSRVQRIDSNPRNDIHHDVAADPGGGLWFTWQADVGGRFGIQARHLDWNSEGAPRLGELVEVSPTEGGHWHPSIACTSDGNTCIAWDAHREATGFDVLTRWRPRGSTAWLPIRVLAEGAEFEGRTDLAADAEGHLWLLWERGAKNWGAPFRGVAQLWNNVTDDRGPLHRLRFLQLVQIQMDGAVHPAPALPAPARRRARARQDLRDGVRDLGIYYERGRLAVDATQRPWVSYRHYVADQVGCKEAVVHHVEEGWRIDARHLSQSGWSELASFDHHQRDGGQRLSIVPHDGGIEALWCTGRTDRRVDPGHHGMVSGSLGSAPGTPPGAPVLPRAWVARELDAADEPGSEGGVVPGSPAPAGFMATFGDLHRHTDLSLCFPFYDGSLDDAYRYGIEVAELDFLGITDHTRDIRRGDVRSQLWWRCTKEVRRHRLPGRFLPYFAFERSHGDTDHNVISLRDDMLRNFPPPLPTFWELIDDGNTFTIPHNPFIGKVWATQDDARRPLMEVFQAFRDENSLTAAHRGLDLGYHLGFIASSDHLSTGASFAGVWTPEFEHEPLFRSMQARRTFGATAKIELALRCGPHWMGERIEVDAAPSFEVQVEGTANVDHIDVVLDGETVQRLDGWDANHVAEARFTLPAEGVEEHWVYVRAVQVDGNEAWSSPIWFTGPGAAPQGVETRPASVDGGDGGTDGDPGRPNLLFVMTDDQAQWAVGAYGNDEIVTPWMDRLAEEGTLFENAFVASPVCSPARATFLTGRYPTELGITEWISPAEARGGLGLRHRTWAQELQDRGYRTGLVGKWHLGESAASHPTALGFEHFTGFLAGGHRPMDPTLEVDGNAKKFEGPLPDVLVDDALRFLAVDDDRPFALCVHFRAPHLPYGPVPEVDRLPTAELDPTLPQVTGLDAEKVARSTRGYYGSIHSVDRNLGRLIQALDAQGLGESTLVVFTSDHGYNEGRHGISTKGNGHWIIGGRTGPKRPNMWDTSISIPWIVRWPGRVPAGVQRRDWITNLDVYRTVLGALGIETEEDCAARGHDVSGAFFGTSPDPGEGPEADRQRLFGQYDLHNNGLAYMRMVRTPTHKLVKYFHAQGMDELYDLVADPEERRNLLRGGGAPGELHAQLEKELLEFMASIEDPLLTDDY